MTPLFRRFLGVLLALLFTKECCGHKENWNCSHTITCNCDSGILVRLPYSVCVSIGSTEVTWYSSQTENSTSELYITEQARCTLKESGNYINNANCSDLKLYQYEYTGIEADTCHIATHLELLEDCTVKSKNATAYSVLPVCACCRSQTNPKSVPQITITPILSSTTLLAQCNFTGLTGATSEPTPSVPSSSASPSNVTGCPLGRVPCRIVYLTVWLGVLIVIAVLLVVVIIVLVCISVNRRKKKMRGTEKAPEEELHTYDVVTQLMRNESDANDQQHIYHRTQHTNTAEQTRDEYHQENTTTQEYEHLHNTRQRSRREEVRGRQHDYEQVSTGEQNGSKTPSSHENLYHVLDAPVEVRSSTAFTTTSADMYSTPNFSSKRPPQSPDTQDHFYHVLEGPTSSTGTSMYSNTDKSTAPGKKEDGGDYDEPIFPTGNKAGHQLFDDPSYQSTFAPVMSMQSHTLPQKLPDEIKLSSNLAYASPVEDQDKMAISDSSYQISALTSPAKPTEERWNDMQIFCKDTQEDNYNQPATITIKNELNSSEEDQPPLFDDPTYQVAFAPV